MCEVNLYKSRSCMSIIRWGYVHLILGDFNFSRPSLQKVENGRKGRRGKEGRKVTERAGENRKERKEEGKNKAVKGSPLLILQFKW